MVAQDACVNWSWKYTEKHNKSAYIFRPHKKKTHTKTHLSKVIVKIGKRIKGVAGGGGLPTAGEGVASTERVGTKVTKRISLGFIGCWTLGFGWSRSGRGLLLVLFRGEGRGGGGHRLGRGWGEGVAAESISASRLLKEKIPFNFSSVQDALLPCIKLKYVQVCLRAKNSTI